jgi:tetratricopeptide (TPR) repeat protein
VAETSTYGADVHSDPLFIDDPEAAEAAREVKAWLAGTRAPSETAKALITCDRMLSLHPGDRLFEGLRLEVENKEREIRLEFMRRLTSELERVPDLDARVESIRQALHRYPSEPYLADLLENATARRDLFNNVIAEARNEEHADAYAQALKRWYLLRELFPMIRGLDNEIRRVETLADTQKRMKRRSEFVDAIFHLSSTGEYTRALYQCLNALAEFPNDGGLLTIKNSLEEKAEHATELQNFVSDGLTFLRAHEIDAALECFGKARAFDQSNLQVRYLIGIALLEKARLVMHDDRRRLNLLLDEAKNFIPSELQTMSFESERMPDENWEKSLVRIELPGTELQRHSEQPAEATSEITPPEAPPAPEQDSGLHAEPMTTRQRRPFPKFALAGLVILAVLAIWIVYMNGSTAEKPSPVPSEQRVDINATPAGAEIFIDDRRVGESRAQAQIQKGNHTVSVRLAGYESRTLPLDVASEPKALQIDLQPLLMDVYLTTDQPGTGVWMDDQLKGDIIGNGITISGVEPGVHVIKIHIPDVEVELSFEFHPGKIPTLLSFPPRQIANVLFAGSADGKARVQCNCAPAGLRVGDFAELIRAEGLELLIEGQRPAELWMGKNRRKLTIQGSRSPVATIAVFSSPGGVRSPVDPGR